MKGFVTALLIIFLAGCDVLTPKTTIHKLVADIEHGDGNEYVNKTIKMDVTLDEVRKDVNYYTLSIRTHADDIIFLVVTDKDKYVKGETYTLKIHINHASRHEVLDIYTLTGYVK